MDCNILIANTKALISYAVTAQVICAFVFALYKKQFVMTPLIYRYQKQKKCLKFSYNFTVSYFDIFFFSFIFRILTLILSVPCHCLSFTTPKLE